MMKGMIMVFPVRQTSRPASYHRRPLCVSGIIGLATAWPAPTRFSLNRKQTSASYKWRLRRKTNHGGQVSCQEALRKVRRRIRSLHPIALQKKLPHA